MAEVNQAHEFFEALFGEKENGHILVWEANGSTKESHWFDTAEEASAFVEQESRSLNMYVGVGLSPHNFGLNKRCSSTDVASISGFWLDLDIMDLSAHQKTNLPPSLNDARKFLHSFDLEPSLVINSGHGLQAWWLFKEPWYFDSDEERDEAAYMAKRFVHTWREKARKRNWDVDSVHDLGRVMRIPGTTNYKSEPVPVKLLKHRKEARYNVDDIEKLLIENVPHTRVEKGMYGRLALDEDANPPTEKLMALIDNDAFFEATLKHKRKDMEGQSPSEFDMSLANTAARAEWTPQEIVDLLIYHRRVNRLPKKLRLDYMERTIATAMESKNKETSQDRLQDLVIQDNMVEKEEDLDITPEKRAEILTDISTMFGIKVLGIERHLSDPVDFFLRTSRGDVNLGGVDNLVKQDKLRLKIAATTKKYIDPIPNKQWFTIAQSLLLVSQDVEVGEEATTRGSMRQWVRDYIRDSEITEDPNVAAETDCVYMSASGVYNVLTKSLQDHIRFSCGTRLTGKQVGQGLRALGAFPTKVNVDISEGPESKLMKRSTRQFWVLPRNV